MPDLQFLRSLPEDADTRQRYVEALRLHKRFPDHVRAKDSDLDASRLETLCDVDVGGIKLGEVPIDRFVREHAEAAMRQLPDRAKRPATRRQYAQIIHRVLALAVYPCRAIKVRPLPRGWL